MALAGVSRPALPGQRPPEEGYLTCHRQGCPEPGGPPQTEHPLPEKMGGHSPLEQEDGRGSAGECPSNHDPPDVRILAVAYPELDGHLRASQQTQGKLDSAQRERVKTPASKAAHKGPGGSVDSSVTPPKEGKGQKKSPKSGRSSTAEKTVIIPATQEATASPIVTGQEATARVSALEGSPIVTGQEATARVSAQEGSASHSPAAQKGPGSHSPAAQ
ncbi:hypothetical protein NDU88_003889 [Pleurodeles waltl]|uniref:Uncharacterized protein n=1 Tax=Pleurodeles waltl TaxID=8319 RepID=A0AAV7NM11_PLEWA|nr:hypothetical protein NDU88_003889 [Pleurodeles waltl]